MHVSYNAKKCSANIQVEVFYNPEECDTSSFIPYDSVRVLLANLEEGDMEDLGTYPEPFLGDILDEKNLIREKPIIGSRMGFITPPKSPFSMKKIRHLSGNLVFEILLENSSNQSITGRKRIPIQVNCQ